MAFNLIPGGSDQNGIVTTMNQNILELKNREKTEIFKDDTGTPRVILDNNGLRTSPAGVDVTTATNAQFTFNSTQNVFKIVDTGVIATPDVSGFTASTGKFNATSSSNSVAHNLGYTPIVIGATSVTSSGTVTNGGILPITVYGPIGAAAGSIFWHDFNIYCDDTYVYLSHTYSGFGGTTGVTFAASSGWSSIKYYLLQETAV